VVYREKKPTLVVILGPTASGKSEVAALLSESIKGEIISCDSMQIYKGMETVTQAPPCDITSRVKHHLVGIISPEKEFNAAEFAVLASRAIAEVISLGKIPVITGGTGLYVKALLEGIFSSPPGDNELRQRLEKEAFEKGNMYLHDKLKKIDPEAANNIDPGNLRRVIRAIEVFELTGKTFSEKKTETKGIDKEYDVKLFALKVPRDVLISRINERVERMFLSGLVEEVKRIMDLEIGLTASKALGIKETMKFISGGSSLDETKREIKTRTRQYAKRQMTWLRAVKGITWIDADRPGRDIAFDIAAKAGLAVSGSEEVMS
jgi:tRNA dimethylallyltransferase